MIARSNNVTKDDFLTQSAYISVAGYKNRLRDSFAVDE